MAWTSGLDPLDVCVVCERPVDRAEVILTAREVGGLQWIERTYGREHALDVVRVAIEDYAEEFGE